MRSGWVFVVGALATVAGPAVGQGSGAATDSSRARIAHITYLTSASAYLDAGRLDGLRDSGRADVIRGGVSVAVLRVAFLASHQASCDIVSTTVPLVTGDSVRFVPAAAAPRDSAAAAQVTARRPASRSSRTPGLRGRVGVEYLSVGQLGGLTGGFSQPSFSLGLDGHPGGSPAVALSVDVRARHTSTILADGSAVTDDRNRVYQAAVSFNAPGSPARLTIGRQVSGNLASVGAFDGGLFEFNRGGWGVGGYSGAQPDPINLAFSSSIVQFGTYVQAHSRPEADAHWSLTLGASDSYDGGQANREFGYVQGSYVGRRLSGFITQEVDYYRSWKLADGMSAISPTSTFAFMHYRMFGGLSLDAGFDNRREVRLYRDVVNPATAFDDTFRQGVWGGLSKQFGSRLRIGVDARSSSGGPSGRADAYTVSLGADRLTTLGLTLRTRSTRYMGPMLTGWLHSITLSAQPGSRIHVSLNGGVRQEMNPVMDPPAKVWATWEGLDVDVNVARSWYFLLSGTRETGGFEGNNQLYCGLNFRF